MKKMIEHISQRQTTKNKLGASHGSFVFRSELFLEGGKGGISTGENLYTIKIDTLEVY